MTFNDDTPMFNPEKYESNELLIFEQFYRSLVHRRISHFAQLWDTSQLTEWPRGSMLHLIDDNFLMNKPIVFVPDVNGFSMKTLPIKKFVMHVTTPPAQTIVPYKETFILPNKGLVTTIMNFKKRNQMKMRPVNEISQFPTEKRAGVQSIISYNSLYRARVLGLLRNPRRFAYIWSCILNMIGSMPNKKHIIPIPVGQGKFTRDMFMLSFKKYDKGSIKRPDDNWYLFMMHLLGFVNSEKTQSIFEYIPEKYWENIFFALYAGPKMIILNLKNLKEFNGTHNTILLRLINQLNDLSETGYALSNTDYGEVEAKYDEKEDNTELVVDATTPFEDDTNSDYKFDPEATKQKDHQSEQPVVTSFGQNSEGNGREKENQVAKDPGKGSEEPKVNPQSLKAPSPNTEIKPVVETSATQRKMEEAAYQFNSILEMEVQELVIDDKWLEVKAQDNKQNSPKFEQPSTQTEQQKFNDDFIEELDQSAANAIKNTQGLTPAQVKRAEVMATAYKSIKVGDRTIEEIIKTVPDSKINENTLDFLKDDPDIVDKSMLNSSVATFETDYIKKMYERDMVMTLVSFNKQGMFLKGLEKKDLSDSLNNIEEYTAKYEDANHKEHTIRFKIPKVDSRGFCYLNGSLKVLKKQRVPNPICKVSPVRVTLNSDYNKYLVERTETVAHSFINYIDRILEKADKSQVSFVLNNHTWYDITLPYEYTAIAKKYDSLSIVGDRFYFNYPERFNWLHDQNFSDNQIKFVKDFEQKYKCYFIGYNRELTMFFFLTLDGKMHVISYTSDEKATVTFIDELCHQLNVEINNLSEWTDFKLLNKQVPTIFALCYRFGLSHMLNYTKCKYEIYDRGTRYRYNFSDVIIKFADKVLIIPRAPLVNSLLFAGLNNFDLTKINIEELDNKDIYYDLLQSKKISIHNLKGIDDFFDLFMDPMTKDVLAQMHEPTNTKDLLIRATQLLSTEDHQPPASSSNFRFRSYERINAAIYKTLSRAYATYKNRAIGATHKWSIADYEISKLVVEDALMENVDLINPINDIKYQQEYSHAGFGGRQSIDTFTVNDRQFPEDGTGVMSEATVDSSKTAYAGSTSTDPTIVNMRGMTVTTPSSELQPTQVLSIATALVPCTTQDDGKRANFVSIHLSHYLPTEGGSVSRVRTGYEKVVAHRTHPPFAYAAEEDGVIELIDKEAHIIRVKYKSGKTVAVSYGDEYTNNGGGGFYCTQNIVINNFEEGSKVKRGDIIIYNDRFFTPDPYSKQVNWNMGVLKDIIVIDSDATLDDSCKISPELAKELMFNPVHIRDVVLKKNTTVHKYAAVGTKLTNIDPILIYDQSEMTDDMFGNVDEDTIAMLGKLNRKTPKAKFTGTVVKIDAYYKCGISEMAPGLRGIVNLINRGKAKRNEAAQGADNQDEFSEAVRIKNTNRIGTTDLDEETVILRFYIQQDMGMHSGDKVEFCTSLKSVCTGINPTSWKLDDGTEAHALFSGIGINNRIICSPIIIGMTTRVLEKLEKDVLKMYFE